MVHKKKINAHIQKKQKPTRSIKKTSRKKYKGRNTRRNYTGGSHYSQISESEEDYDDIGDDGDDDIGDDIEDDGDDIEDDGDDIEDDGDDDIGDDIEDDGDDIEDDDDIDVDVYDDFNVCHKSEDIPNISKIGGAINYISSKLPPNYNLILKLKGKRPGDVNPYPYTGPNFKNINKKIKALKSKIEKKADRRTSIRSSTPWLIRPFTTPKKRRRKRTKRTGAISGEIRTLNNTIKELKSKRKKVKYGWRRYIQLINDYHYLTDLCKYNVQQRRGLLLDNNNNDHSQDDVENDVFQGKMDHINALVAVSNRSR